MPAKVAAIEYDPNRSARIALLFYVDGEKRYILAPNGLNVGDTVVASDSADIRPGNTLTIKSIPLGTWVHNVELKVGKGGQLARSAGAYAMIAAKEGRYAQLRLPSGEVRLVMQECRATVGQVGNLDYEKIKIGKAGRNRWLGKRPQSRGVAMNLSITHMVVVRVRALVDVIRLLLGVFRLKATKPEQISGLTSLLSVAEIRSNHNL